jgi:hypothetical protein
LRNFTTQSCCDEMKSTSWASPAATVAVASPIWVSVVTEWMVIVPPAAKRSWNTLASPSP